MRRRDEILGMWEQLFQGRVESVDFERGVVQIGTTYLGNTEVVGSGGEHGSGGAPVPEVHAGAHPCVE